MQSEYLPYIKLADKDSAFKNIAFKITLQITDYFSHS